MKIAIFNIRLRKIRRELILLSLFSYCSGLVSTIVQPMWQYRHPSLLSCDSFHTPVIRIWDTEMKNSKGMVVMVHGFQCNKSMMVQLGKFLAAQGLDVYAIDLPGHGESSVPFTFERCYEAAKVALSEIIRLSGAEDRQVILIGHSFGAMVLGPVALERPNIAGIHLHRPGGGKEFKGRYPAQRHDHYGRTRLYPCKEICPERI